MGGFRDLLWFPGRRSLRIAPCKAGDECKDAQDIECAVDN